MVDENNYTGNPFLSKKKEQIRVFIRRKHSSYKSVPKQTNNFQQLTSMIENYLNKNQKKFRKKKNVLLINYKPVYTYSRQHKSIVPESPLTSQAKPIQNPTKSSFPSKIIPPSAACDLPDVEDPFMFIEMMYQQLFTEDGQLRTGTEPAVLANCVKQIVSHSRRNSMAYKDSLEANTYQRKYSTTSMPAKNTLFSSSPSLIPDIFTEEEEEPNTISQKIRSVRTSTRSSNDHTDHQQLHAFLRSYHHQRQRSSTYQNTLKPDNILSIDDTDNEDLDTFSDLNSARKPIHISPSGSIDDDATLTDSKVLLSSGYQSVTSHQTMIYKRPSTTDQQYCTNCSHTPQITVISSTSSLLINIFQPIRDIFTKYLNFILISKNILIVPFFIFLLHQRSMIIGN